MQQFKFIMQALLKSKCSLGPAPLGTLPRAWNASPFVCYAKVPQRKGQASRISKLRFLTRMCIWCAQANKVKPCTNRGRIRAQACLPSMQCALWESVKAIAMHVVQPIHFLQHGLALLLSGITSLASHLCQSLSATQTQSALHTVHSIGWSLLHG